MPDAALRAGIGIGVRAALDRDDAGITDLAQRVHMAAEIGIIGTGAMGCLFGGYLSRRADVTLLTHRKQQAQAIEETGLSIQTDEGPVACGSLRAVCAAEASEVFDLLVVFVKAFQTRDAIESIRGCIGPETVILTLQNGIGNGQTLQQLFRPEQILVGTSTINSQRLSDTAVSQHGGMGITTIGTVSAARRRSPSRRQRFSPAAASAPRPARILTV